MEDIFVEIDSQIVYDFIDIKTEWAFKKPILRTVHFSQKIKTKL